MRHGKILKENDVISKALVLATTFQKVVNIQFLYGKNFSNFPQQFMFLVQAREKLTPGFK